MAEVCEKKPADPIEYLSKWLRKHVENLEDNVKVIYMLDFIFVLNSKHRNASNKRPGRLLNFSNFYRGVYSKGAFIRGGPLLNNLTF